MLARFGAEGQCKTASCKKSREGRLLTGTATDVMSWRVLVGVFCPQFVHQKGA